MRYRLRFSLEDLPGLVPPGQTMDGTHLSAIGENCQQCR